MSIRSKKKLLLPSERRLKQFAADLDSKRSCGTCTACCDAIGVEEINKGEYTPCKHLCAVGCAVYKNRPKQCREYLCGWKAVWTPEDESWRPDNLGVIFDIHAQGMGDGKPAIRCWQLRSATQVLDDPQVRKMAYALAIQFKLPVVARYKHIMNISVHLLPQFDWVFTELKKIDQDVPAYLLTLDVIPDPQDFFRERESTPVNEITELMDQFGHRAYSKSIGRKPIENLRVI